MFTRSLVHPWVVLDCTGKVKKDDLLPPERLLIQSLFLKGILADEVAI